MTGVERVLNKRGKMVNKFAPSKAMIVAILTGCFLTTAACQAGPAKAVDDEALARFDAVAASFDEQVTALEIPAHQLSFVENLNAIEDAEALTQQQNVLTAQLETVRGD